MSWDLGRLGPGNMAGDPPDSRSEEMHTRALLFEAKQQVNQLYRPDPTPTYNHLISTLTRLHIDDMAAEAKELLPLIERERSLLVNIQNELARSR